MVCVTSYPFQTLPPHKILICISILIFSLSIERRYTRPLDVFIKTMRSEGPLAFLKGTTASWMRLGPGITISFIVYEQLRKVFGVAPI